MKITVPTTEHAYMLMLIAEGWLCTVQKYYWTSKFSPDYIEYIEPKIYDAFNCTVELIGEESNLKDCIEVYNQNSKRLNGLRNETFLSEKEIKKIANRFFSKIFN